MILKHTKTLFIAMMMVAILHASPAKAEPITDITGPPIVLAFWGQSLLDSIHKDISEALDRFYAFMQSAWDTLSGYLKECLKWFWTDVVEKGFHQLSDWFLKWFEEYAKPYVDPIWAKVKDFGSLSWDALTQWTPKVNAFIPLDIGAAELTFYMGFWALWSLARIVLKLVWSG